ncbi:ChaN family lipoprotein, partial [Bowmanella yangjiangensis]
MRILLLCCLSLLVACQSRGVLPPPAPIASEGRDHGDLGVILDLRSGERITPQRLVERLARASRVVVGEQHDNPDHHALQLWLSRELEARRPQGSVLLEMLNPSQQTRVDQVRAETRAGRPPLDAIRALAWQPRWDWAMYGALVRYQLRQPYPLLAANLDREEIMRIYQQRPALQGQASTAAAVQQRLQRDIRESHCGLLPE